jgi:hypothetical protein
VGATIGFGHGWTQMNTDENARIHPCESVFIRGRICFSGLTWCAIIYDVMFSTNKWGRVSRPAQGAHALPGRTWRSGADVDVCAEQHSRNQSHGLRGREAGQKCPAQHAKSACATNRLSYEKPCVMRTGGFFASSPWQ